MLLRTSFCLLPAWTPLPPILPLMQDQPPRQPYPVRSLAPIPGCPVPVPGHLCSPAASQPLSAGTAHGTRVSEAWALAVPSSPRGWPPPAALSLPLSGCLLAFTSSAGHSTRDSLWFPKSLLPLSSRIVSTLGTEQVLILLRALSPRFVVKHRHTHTHTHTHVVTCIYMYSHAHTSTTQIH